MEQKAKVLNGQCILTVQILSIMSWYILDSNRIRRAHSLCYWRQTWVILYMFCLHTWDSMAKRPKTCLTLVLLLILIPGSGSRKDFLGLCCEEAGTNNNSVSGLPRWLSGTETTCQCKRHRRWSWIRKIPWRRKWQPTPVFLPRKSYGQKSRMGCNSGGCKETEHPHMHSGVFLFVF